MDDETNNIPDLDSIMTTPKKEGNLGSDITIPKKVSSQESDISTPQKARKHYLDFSPTKSDTVAVGKILNSFIYFFINFNYL